MLHKVEILVLQYLLFADDFDTARYMLASLLIRTPPQKQIQQHNWYVMRGVKDTDPGFFLANGEAVENLKVPLFPLTPELAHLNDTLCSAEYLSGGDSSDDHPIRKLYRKRRSPLFEDDFEGGDAPWSSRLPVYNNENVLVGYADSAALERLIAAGMADSLGPCTAACNVCKPAPPTPRLC